MLLHLLFLCRKLAAAACFHCEGLAVGTLLFCRVVLVCADLDCVKRAVVYAVAMVLAACDGALDAFIRIFVHFKIPP